jgi:hypothetical protein
VDRKFSSSAFGNPYSLAEDESNMGAREGPHSMHLVILRTAKGLTLFMPPRGKNTRGGANQAERVGVVLKYTPAHVSARPSSTFQEMSPEITSALWRVPRWRIA